jgi:NAD(P)H-hydrate epimerase
MENAGRGAALLLVQLGIAGRVVVCAGRGNNGGDGFVMARHLDNLGFAVRVLLCASASELAGDAKINFDVLVRSRANVVECGREPDLESLARELTAADWIIDALVGTGSSGALREPAASIVSVINAASRRVLAVDLPSGFDCDTGLAQGACVRALHTATFVARKIGFDRPGARDFTGDVHVIDIGVPRRLLEELSLEPETNDSD